MNSIKIAHQAATELAQTLNKIDEKQVTQLINHIKKSQRIFVAGAGRSLLMLKAFAMRLMHIGYEVYIVGEVTTPAFLANDLLLIASASGETRSLVSIAERGKNYGGKIVVLTIFEASSLAKLADASIKIPAYTDKLPESQLNQPGILPGGSLFEEAVLLLGDSLILELVADRHIDTSKAFEKHANLE